MKLLTRPPSQFDDKAKADFIRIRDLVESTCHTISISNPQTSPHSPSLDPITFERFLLNNHALPTSIAVMAISTRALLGVEPGDISALYFLNYLSCGGGLLRMRSDSEHGGQYLRIRSGTQSISTAIAASLPRSSVRLSTPVSGITQSSTGITVSTRSGQIFHAKKVICSLPTTMYKRLTFSPPLPNAKQALADATRYGYYTKTILVFSSPFWTLKFCGLAQSLVGPANVVRDTSVSSDNHYDLTFFLVGAPGRAWSALSYSQQTETLLKQAARLFTGGDVQKVKGVFLERVGNEWVKEEFGGWGCPSPTMGVGLMGTVGGELRTKWGGVEGVYGRGRWKWG
jgi:monoamine oxidase